MLSILLNKKKFQSIISGPLTEVNISGAGLRFHTDENFKLGDFVELNIVLPPYPYFIIESIGKIVRISRENSKTKEVAVKFVAISEDNREMLIKYVFKRQRELLRSKTSQQETINSSNNSNNFV